MKILVTGAGGPAAYNFVQSLRMEYNKINAFVVGVDINEYHLAANDILDVRYLIRLVSHPDYLDILNDIIKRESIDLVHPQPDVEVEFISDNREKINARTFLPSKEAVTICRDKLMTHRLLKYAGVPVPATEHFKDRFEKKAFDSIPSEVKWIRANKGAGSRAALPTKRLELAIEWKRYWREMRELENEDFMISEFLPGREFAWQSLWCDGILQTSMARERKEYMFGNLMPSGQSSSPSVARSLHWDKLNLLGNRAVRAIDKKPNGIYCIDIKENALGEPCVTEINAGRFFTTSNFFSAIGANMPQQFVLMAMGEDQREPLLMFNAADSEKYWIRSVDTYPRKLSYERIQSRVIKAF